jgi:protoporphyrinogen oxidase
MEYIIIGAGIAGLYLGYLLKKKNKRFIIIEKNDCIGGRIKTDIFHGKNINLGAGIFLNNHTNLIELLKELNIEYKSFTSEQDFMDNQDLDKVCEKVNNVIMKFYKTDLPDITFREFMNIYLDNDTINLINKYRDFDEPFDMNIHTVINKYSIQDIITKSKKEICSVTNTWNELLEKIGSKIKNNIILENKVIEINKNIKYEVITDKVSEFSICKNKYIAEKVIICGDYTCNNIKMRNVNNIFINILKNIKHIPTMRIYVKHKKYKIDKILRSEHMLFKLIPITEEITMASYCDDLNADLVKNFTDRINNFSLEKKTELLEKMINNTFKINLEIEDIKVSYWDNSIHYMNPNLNYKVLDNYYKVIDKLFFIHNFALVGEYVNDCEFGYLENAVDSVNKFVKKINL